MLKAQDISVAHQGRSLFVGLSLGLDRGELLPVLGPSGSGKSSLLLALARFVPLIEGKLYLGEHHCTAFYLEKWRSQIRYVGQKPVTLASTVAEEISYSEHLKIYQDSSSYDKKHHRKDAQQRSKAMSNRERMVALLSTVGLAYLSLETTPERLSGGELARLAILRSLWHRPSVLLLDEPFAFLDHESLEKTARLLRSYLEEGGAIVLISHVAPPAQLMSYAQGSLSLTDYHYRENGSSGEAS